MEETGERRRFSMHSNLLWDVIERQRGDMSGALMECVTNSIEAGATTCQITIEPNRLVIEDDGRGFRSRQEIEEYFEVFGKSDERKAASTRWAAFSMGRAQAWCWGRTTYRTRTFEMVVDLRSCDGDLTYCLTGGLEDRPGCRVEVELYDEIRAFQIARISADTRTAVEYVGTPVVLNGVRVSKDPRDEQWDFETDDAWARFKGRSLRVYNLGAFVVEEQSSRDLGTGAIVVTKTPLLVNFARNSIGRCPVWRRILSDLRAQARRHTLAKKRLTTDEARFAVEQWIDGHLDVEELYRTPVFRDTNGKHWSLESVARAGLRVYALDKKESFMADRAMQAGLAVVLDEAHAERVFGGYLADGLFVASERINWLGEAMEEFDSEEFEAEEFRYVSTAELYASIEMTDELVAKADYRPSERAIVGLLNTMQPTITATLGIPTRRRILLGRSKAAVEWTDAKSWIAFDRDFLTANVRTTSGFATLLLTLSHEYAHTGGDPRTHDAGFYERFHNFAHKAAGLVDVLAQGFQRKLTARQLKVSARERDLRDRLSRLGSLVDVTDGTTAASDWDESMERDIETAARARAMAEPGPKGPGQDSAGATRSSASDEVAP